MMLSSFIEAVVCATHTTELVSGTKLGLDVILTILCGPSFFLLPFSRVAHLYNSVPPIDGSSLSLAQ